MSFRLIILFQIILCLLLPQIQANRNYSFTMRPIPIPSSSFITNSTSIQSSIVSPSSKNSINSTAVLPTASSWHPSPSSSLSPHTPPKTTPAANTDRGDVVKWCIVTGVVTCIVTLLAAGAVGVSLYCLMKAKKRTHILYAKIQDY